ncbi:MAG: hypothetical protein SV186_03140 [Candidatus Nanohaloarchaea archaeon]|nr:hypothetical protein [Candidatus Nanohaloarchaea archaeon]
MSDTDQYLEMDSVKWMDEQNTLVLRNSEEERYRMVPVGQDVGEELLPEAYDAVFNGEEDEYADMAKHSIDYAENDIGTTTVDYDDVDLGLQDAEVLETELDVNGEGLETRVATGILYSLLGDGDIRVHEDLTAEQDALQYVASLEWDWVRANQRDLDEEFTAIDDLSYDAATTELGEYEDEVVFDGFESEEIQQQGIQAMMGGQGMQEITWTRLDSTTEDDRSYRMQTIPEAGEMLWKEYQQTEGAQGSFQDEALESINTYTPISLPSKLFEDGAAEPRLYGSFLIDQDGESIQPHSLKIQLDKEDEDPVVFEAPAGLTPHYVPSVDEQMTARSLTEEEREELMQQQQQQQAILQGGQDQQAEAQQQEPDLDYIQ